MDPNRLVDNLTAIHKMIQQQLYTDLSKVFVAWEFLAACLAIALVITTFKQFIKQGCPRLLNLEWFKAIMTIVNLALGVLIAIPHNFLFGNTFFQRMIVGLIAGGVSHLVYHLVIKRVAAILGTTESEIDNTIEGKDTTDSTGKK